MPDKIEPPAPRYIGDGVYASFDGYQFWLETIVDNHTNRIALDSDVFTALIEYRASVHRHYREAIKEVATTTEGAG